MRKINLLLLFVVLYFTANSQITFQRNYNPGGLIDMFSAVKQTSDDGYIMTGSKIGLGSTVIVVKTDTTGAIEWSKEYAKSGFFTSAMSSDIILTSDGGYMVSGAAGSDFFLMKLDANGNVQWDNAYNKAEEDNANFVYQTSDNGYLVTGSTRLTSNDSLSAIFFKVNSSGSIQWAQHWDYLPGTDDILYAASECSDGYIATGYLSEIDDQGTSNTDDDDTTSNLIIVKVDLNGNNPTGKVYGVLTNNEQGHDLIKIATDEYIITGYTSENTSGLDGGDALLLQIDNDGNKLMAATYDIGLIDMGESIIQTSSGDYAIIGYTMEGSTMENFLFDVTSSGIFNFGLTYSGGPSFYVMADGVQTSDDGFIWGTMGTDNSYDYYLIKTDETGHSNCWENDMTTSSQSLDPTINIIAGTFTAGIGSGSLTMDASDAGVTTDEPECIIVPCDTPTVAISPVAPTICNGDNQLLTASGANSYEWSTTETTNAITVSPSATTSYTVTGYDASGICPSDPFTVTVSVNQIPTITVGSNSPICVGYDLNLTETGNDATSWSWTGPNSFVSTDHNPTINNVTSLEDGMYYVTISDGICTNTGSVDVTVNNLPNAQITGDDEICVGESSTLTASGGGTYSWSTGESGATITVNPSITIVYTVTVNNGCDATATFQVKVNQLPTVSFTGDTLICNGDATTITASGGDSYVWSTSETTADITVSPTDTTTYCVTVTDALTTCSNNDCITIYVTEKPVITFTGNTEICLGDTTTLTASGGLTYQWNTSSTSDNITVFSTDTITYYVTVTTSCPNNDSITVNVNPLPTVSITGDIDLCLGDTTTLTANGADNYAWGTIPGDNISINPLSDTLVYVSGTISATGCSAEISQNITVNSLPVISFSGDTIICLGDNASITANGGNDYIWDIGDNTANISVSPINNTTYFVTVTNTTTTCLNNDSVNVFVNPLPTISTSNDTTICFGGTAQIWANGGNTYSWTPASNLSDANIYNPTASPSSTTTYVVNVTDNNTCSNTDTITVNVLQAPSYDINNQQVNCYGDANGELSISNFNGQLPVTYYWSTGSTNDTINNLPADTYNLTITDGIGCEYLETLTVTSPEEFSDSIVVTNLNCFGDDDGSIYPYISGGTTPYSSYNWSNGGFNNHLSNIPAGTYSLTVTDANGCIYSIDKIDVIEPEELIADVTAYSNILCNGENNGSISTNIIGGTEPYNYVWSNGSTNLNLTNLSAGTYILSVTDAHSCQDTAGATLTEPNILNYTDSIYTENYMGGITVYANGGTPSYNYEWSDGESGNTVENLVGGEYYLTITDANNCQIITLFNIDIPVIIPNVITPNADGINDNFEITNIASFEEVDIQIFNRWGDKLFEYSGTGMGYADVKNQWNGTFKGKELPLGSYIYIIDLHNDDDPYNGTVTIIR